MDIDFLERFKSCVLEIETSGRDYAEKKAKSWQAQELKYAVLAEEMKKLPSDWPFNLRESNARTSEGFRQYIKETSNAIKEENIAKAIYEKARANFEALRCLISLEKTTRQIIHD